MVYVSFWWYPNVHMHIIQICVPSWIIEYLIQILLMFGTRDNIRVHLDKSVRLLVIYRSSGLFYVLLESQIF